MKYKKLTFLEMNMVYNNMQNNEFAKDEQYAMIYIEDEMRWQLVLIIEKDI